MLSHPTRFEALWSVGSELCASLLGKSDAFKRVSPSCAKKWQNCSAKEEVLPQEVLPHEVLPQEVLLARFCRKSLLHKQ